MYNFTCFLIDDDEDDREIFGIALKEVGNSIEYITAKNGVEAIEMLKNDEDFVPNFIFVDLNMPLMSGHECLLEMRKISRLKHIPIIIYSTSSHEKDIKLAERNGAAHFLEKPTSIDKLIQILIKLFSLAKLKFKIKI